jgi:T5SS/PEP-CTERM-associated repeat protein
LSTEAKIFWQFRRERSILNSRSAHVLSWNSCWEGTAMIRSGAVWLSALVVITATASYPKAAADVWDGNGAVPPNNNWNFDPSWDDNTAPGNTDTATFNIAATYTVSFSVTNPDAIQALTVSSGNVTFASTSSTGRTLRVNSASGTQDISITGASTSLTLGAAPSNDVSLIAGDNLSVQNDAIITAQFGSDITASDFSLTGLNGTIVIDGAGSILTLNGAGVNNFIGRSGNTGTLAFLGGSTGNSIAGDLGIANSGAANSEGYVPVQGGSTVSLAGNLTMANQDVAGQIAALGIDGAGSSLTQTGAGTITVGADTNGTATIEIGVANDGGTLTTGTGLFTINATGEVTIGAIAGPPPHRGTLNANGNVLIDGGVLRRIAGDFILAADKMLTVQDGGLLDIRSSYDADANFIVTGAGSTWTTSIDLSIGAAGTGSLTIVQGGTVSNNLGLAHVGESAGSNGSATVRGAGSTWTSGADLIVGEEGTGTLTIEQGSDVSSNVGAVGFGVGGNGTATVTGAGSTWTNTLVLRIGKEGTGSLTISAGGDVSNTAGRIGIDPIGNRLRGRRQDHHCGRRRRLEHW